MLIVHVSAGTVYVQSDDETLLVTSDTTFVVDDWDE
jgi:hypothetical protein